MPSRMDGGRQEKKPAAFLLPPPETERTGGGRCEEGKKNVLPPRSLFPLPSPSPDDEGLQDGSEPSYFLEAFSKLAVGRSSSDGSGQQQLQQTHAPPGVDAVGGGDGGVMGDEVKRKKVRR